MKKLLILLPFLLFYSNHSFAFETKTTLASWYGNQFHGRKTASGEKFNMYCLSAAHKTLPLGTKVRITNIENKKSIIARITDRGPFVKGRDLDLSYGAAKALGTDKKGIARVNYQVVK